MDAADYAPHVDPQEEGASEGDEDDEDGCVEVGGRRVKLRTLDELIEAGGIGMQCDEDCSLSVFCALPLDTIQSPSCIPPSSVKMNT